MNIFAAATLCSSNCTTVNFATPTFDICSGAIVGTKKVKGVFFDCKTAAGDLASVATISNLITTNQARVVVCEEFSINYSPITTSIDPKTPDQTIGYTFEATFKDNRWYSTTFVNIDQSNEIAAKILNLHFLFVDEDDEMRLFRTTLAIEVMNNYLTGENDKKVLDFKVRGKYYTSSTQPHLNKPTIIAGLYQSL